MTSTRAVPQAPPSSSVPPRRRPPRYYHERYVRRAMAITAVIALLLGATITMAVVLATIGRVR